MTAHYASLKALLMDVDGVLTDGSIWLDAQGQEMKRFHVWDGAAIQWLQKQGIPVGWITGRSSVAVQTRARELGVVLRDGVREKQASYQEFLALWNLQESETGYIGDDLIDIPVLKRVGFSFAVENACDEVKQCAQYITQKSGGSGAVREIIELILKSQEKWTQVLRSFS
ncbi:MAG: HAD hydrolase family protein [Planctomycetota bacterium]